MFVEIESLGWLSGETYVLSVCEALSLFPYGSLYTADSEIVRTFDAAEEGT